MMKGAFGVGWDGMDGIGMVILGQWYSMSTFGTNDDITIIRFAHE